MKNTPGFLLSLVLVLATMAALPCRAELSELQVKSAYVFNFIKFVKWPASAVKPEGRIRLCVIGSKDLRASLATLDERRVGEYVLHVAPYPDSTEELNDCNVLYIGEHEQRRHLQIIKSLGNAPTLTISDIQGFAERGGGIGLLHRDEKLLFEVNLASTRKAGLQLSGQMLNLSANVFGK
ncbi:MAG: YfiR family protein [Nitrosomonadales bacterium]|nr:YfiR family protein [Nitrosomonadales bacterium]